MVRRRPVVFALGSSLTLSLGGCLGGRSEATATPADTSTATPVGTPEPSGGLSLSTPAFDDGGTVPTRYTCSGDDVSPRLEVDGVPDDAESLALVVDDPDAPRAEPFVHWLLWNVSPDVDAIPEDVPHGETVETLDGARQGTNSAGSVGYAGPCPPRGDGPHTYRFTLSALDTKLDLSAGADRSALDSATSGSILAQSRVTGEFERK